MKVDKRITNCIIAATVLIVIVATAPVLSNSSVALAQQPPKTADLTIENVVRANCHFIDQETESKYCPQWSNTGMTTTIRILHPPNLPFVFPAGPWAVKTEKVFKIPIDALYAITTDLKTNTVPFPGEPGKRFYFDGSNIQGDCEGTDTCHAQMGPGGAKVIVNYHWGHH